jgi:ABC-type uncharacterized transport system ATPase component
MLLAAEMRAETFTISQELVVKKTDSVKWNRTQLDLRLGWKISTIMGAFSGM